MTTLQIIAMVLIGLAALFTLYRLLFGQPMRIELSVLMLYR